MSTRCVTYFSSAPGCPPNAQREANRMIDAAIYRHHDGYPSHAGKDLLKFLQLDREATTGSRVGDTCYLSGRYLAFLASERNAGSQEIRNWTGTELEILPAPGITNPVDFLSCGIGKPQLGYIGDVEWEYWVDSIGRVYVRTAAYGWNGSRARHGRWGLLSTDETPQLVQVTYPRGGRSYTYGVPVGMTVAVGDEVEVPVPWGDTVATVVELGSDYDGPVEQIHGVVTPA